MARKAMKRLSVNNNIEMDEFLGVCKIDPDYVAEKGLKCFRHHTLCRFVFICTYIMMQESKLIYRFVYF